ncbi:MAG: sulfur carrier protein ThiS [Odoribacteraceae bacterium]|jgi:sulfur carrier protein|nr:sulfur carrier protein ThiS [Odoribacteraceae bacterium]
MRISINNKDFDCEPGSTLKQVLETSGFDATHAAVALDLEVIPREAWETTAPGEGSSIIIIKAAQGG